MSQPFPSDQFEVVLFYAVKTIAVVSESVLACPLSHHPAPITLVFAV